MGKRNIHNLKSDMLCEPEDTCFFSVLKPFLKVWNEVRMPKADNGMDALIGAGENNPRACFGLFSDEISMPGRKAEKVCRRHLSAVNGRGLHGQGRSKARPAARHGSLLYL